MADFWDSEELISKFVKTAGKKFKLKVSKNNKSYVDIRTFGMTVKAMNTDPARRV